MTPGRGGLLLTWMCLAAAGAAAPAPPAARGYVAVEGGVLIGRPAPEWSGLTWVQGGPLSIEELRGKPVLVRFWTDGCAYCAATAPALVRLWDDYGARGLVVVGIHHPKSRASHDVAVVREAAEAFGFRFPVATDADWRTVRAYGVGTTFQQFTSISVLVGPDGTIRWVHDGGEYHEGGGPSHEDCDAAYRSLRAAIDELLPPAPAQR